jgi:hypothetical protein
MSQEFSLKVGREERKREGGGGRRKDGREGWGGRRRENTSGRIPSTQRRLQTSRDAPKRFNSSQGNYHNSHGSCPNSSFSYFRKRLDDPAYSLSR